MTCINQSTTVTNEKISTKYLLIKKGREPNKLIHTVLYTLCDNSTIYKRTIFKMVHLH